MKAWKIRHSWAGCIISFAKIKEIAISHFYQHIRPEIELDFSDFEIEEYEIDENDHFKLLWFYEDIDADFIKNDK